MLPDTPDLLIVARSGPAFKVFLPNMLMVSLRGIYDDESRMVRRWRQSGKGRKSPQYQGCGGPFRVPVGGYDL
jgi:hypothetical protein